jgi:nicotinamidase-related amidase
MNMGSACSTQAATDTQPFRTFKPSTAKGGIGVDASKTAVLCIEYQNEFTTEGGKLHGAVGPVMKTTNMLDNTVGVCAAAREAGAKVFHEAISFAEDASDNPNKGLGILAGCAGDKLFTAGTWNADFCEQMTPQGSDIVVLGKKGLDGFPGTDLEEQLVTRGIETVAICGFLTNCCVESTMRTAYEKGFNVITLSDCCAATSEEGQKAAIEGTFGMFSKTMTAEEFKAELSK